MKVSELIAMLQDCKVNPDAPVFIYDPDMEEMAKVGGLVFDSNGVDLVPEGYD